MEFEWDEDKRREVLAKHGIDFTAAAAIFAGPVLTRIDGRREYGETRQVSIGTIGDRFIVVVHTDRNGRKRLISAWEGGRFEREQYQARFS